MALHLTIPLPPPWPPPAGHWHQCSGISPRVSCSSSRGGGGGNVCRGGGHGGGGRGEAAWAWQCGGERLHGHGSGGARIGRMNLNKYMAAVDRPLGVRFALAINRQVVLCLNDRFIDVHAIIILHRQVVFARETKKNGGN
uniref:Uncharacterized protein n=1 Tax=Oryza meridionalis TaxID=40149 RepID=A0A0E0ESS2_9ORYZ